MSLPRTCHSPWRLETHNRVVDLIIYVPARLQDGGMEEMHKGDVWEYHQILGKFRGGAGDVKVYDFFNK